VISSINTVHAASRVLLSNMEDLGKQAESIGGVMNVIRTSPTRPTCWP